MTSHEKYLIVTDNLAKYYAIDIESGSMLWQRPTQANIGYADSFSLKTSDLIASNDLILFSNNKNIYMLK